jgi:hypothetical protein
MNAPARFCERVPGVAKVHARYTERLDEIVGVVGYVAGGLPGARLLEASLSGRVMKLFAAVSGGTFRHRRNISLFAF